MNLSRNIALVLACTFPIALVGCTSSASASAPDGPITQLTFASPEDAVAALVYLASGEDRSYGRALFGPEADGFSSGDSTVDAYERQRFAAAIRRHHEIRGNADGTVDILIGQNKVPFPVPLVQVDGRWMFDTPDGVERLTDIRVGFYELKTVEALRAVAAAQREYYNIPRDKDGVKAYATRFISTEGARDGLYWPTGPNEPNSPLGAFFADAEAPRSQTRGYNGYFYKMLTAQGPGAPGGPRYLDSQGRLTGGYAVLAYPAVYDQTGVMTFIMGPDGIIYEKDLGRDATPDAGTSITVFDPAGWTPTRD